jgi:hypothetical protein
MHLEGLATRSVASVFIKGVSGMYISYMDTVQGNFIIYFTVSSISIQNGVFPFSVHYVRKITPQNLKIQFCCTDYFNSCPD